MSFKIDSKNVFKKQAKKIVGDIETEALKEVSEVSDFSKKLKAENDLFKDNTDANYFTVVTFNNSKQLDEFISKIGLTPSDKQYIDGVALAKKLGIEIETPNKPAPCSFKVNKGLLDLVM